jgi:hypothetical protein
MRLRLLTSAIGTLVPVATLSAVVWIVLPIFSLDPNANFNVRGQPYRFAIVVLVAFVVVTLLFYLGALVAAWVALKRYTHAEVEKEFCWLLALPGTAAANRRLFQFVFRPRTAV